MDGETSSALSSLLKTQNSTNITLSSPHTISLPLLSIFDSTTLPSSSITSDHLQSHTRDAIQVLINSIFSLPLVGSLRGESSDPHHVPTVTSVHNRNNVSNEPLVKLPSVGDLERQLLPREKKLPIGIDKKPLTRWEEFARRKGIGKKRKEKKVWDEDKGEWRDRWGYAKKMKEKEGMEDWAVEVKDGEDGVDPRSAGRKKVKLEKGKNEAKRQGNLMRAAKALSKDKVEKEGKKDELDRKIGQVGKSTTAMGKFKEAGEVGRNKGDRRKFESNIPTEGASTASERTKQMEILKRLEKEPKVSGKKRKAENDGEINVRKAIKGLNGERREKRK
jgi:regulator of ribosome biosynthesis